MKRYILSTMLAAAAIALAPAPSVAAAQDPSFTATLSGGAFAVAKDGKYYVYDLAGRGTKLGTCTGVFENHYSNGSNTLVGFATITAATGDSLDVEYTQTWNGTQWVGQYNIVGGIGRFADATGSGAMGAAFNAAHTVVTVTFEGTISF